MPKSAQPIIIKKVKKAAHGHHGGAWKIAYADFVTAMMAFFLLMWLISMTSKEQKIGISDYFTPGAVKNNTTGAGTALPSAATAKSDESTAARANDRGASRPVPSIQAHNSAAASLRQALQSKPEIAELSRNVMIEPTKEGLNVSIVDQDGRSMFPDGLVQPYQRTRLVLEALAPTLRRLPNRLSVTGHTSSARPGAMQGMDAWSLTAGRALAVREVLAGAGLPDSRFASVAGRSDTEPVFPDNPYIAANRRVTITLLNEAPPLPPNVLR